MANTTTYGMRRITCTVTSAGTRVPISPTSLFTTDFEVHVAAGNVGANMYIGNITVDNSWIPRAKGTTRNFTSGQAILIGMNQDVGFDLNKIYLDADANGDVAIIQYFAQDKPS